ncbi:hypothetical protein BgiMline_021684 [Biomphalaria glabrata]|uniref:Uncharacterized protein LOC106057344 n=1 Tax=Biomphalaria glabrata TaxID=6526 RepID=A0A2C9L7H9_BIOGL|nr:uncharacterized protein LOC106057344 [Biomphalaria glabrata]KAI8734042.1 hypothetical protein BgiMline_028269 [Biomphalaria glabrata]KAI8761630.1 hypothetical protein BgiBS90_030662 [Biomphalaria glabrata]
MKSITLLVTFALVQTISSTPCTDLCGSVCENGKFVCDATTVLPEYFSAWCVAGSQFCQMACGAVCGCVDSCGAQCGAEWNKCSGEDPSDLLKVEFCEASYANCIVTCGTKCGYSNAVGLLSQAPQQITSLVSGFLGSMAGR